MLKVDPQIAPILADFVQVIPFRDAGSCARVFIFRS
jgi:hypothetical protein